MPGGKFGCGTILIVIIGALVFGVDPGQMLGTVESMQGSSPSQQQARQGASVEQLCSANDYALEACNALSSLNETWEPLFNKANIAFSRPTLNFYQGGTRSGCGAASSAMGPFYCPSDQGIYIDTSFYDTMDREMGAGGDFARYYVVAHANRYAVCLRGNFDFEILRLRMAHHVGDGFLDDAEDGDVIRVCGQCQCRVEPQLQLQSAATGNAMQVAFECGEQAQLIQQWRAQVQ